MQVETYEVEEVAAEAVDDTARELIERLELDGQKTFLAPDPGGQRFSFRKLTDEEDFVYSTLCPQHRAVEKYDSEPIPTRVLMVLALARETGRFGFFQVWSPKDARIPDPVLIGFTGANEYSIGDRYLLARWGPVLEGFDALKTIAGRLWKQRMKACLAEISHDVQRQTNALADIPDDGVYHVRNPYMSGEPSFSGPLR